MRFALDDQHIGAAGLRQVIRNTRPNDSAADDDDVCGFHDGKSKEETVKSKDCLCLESEMGHDLKAF